MGRRDAVQRGAEVGMLLADRDDRVLPIATHHIAVQVGDHIRKRDRRVLREELAAPQAALLSAHGHEGERTPGMRREPRERLGGLEYGRRAGGVVVGTVADRVGPLRDRKSTRLNSSHSQISYAVFCLKKKTRRSRRT